MRIDFWSRVRKTDTCWLWAGCVSSGGYGRVGRKVAHRLAYEELRGPVPHGLYLDHLCRVRNCVNPDHLEPVTHRENTLRGINQVAIGYRRETCFRGHQYKKLKPGRNGYPKRICYTCENLMRNVRRALVRSRQRTPEGA